jgi:NAD(P)H-quinone oxidoreductase subunit 5
MNDELLSRWPALLALTGPALLALLGLVPGRTLDRHARVTASAANGLALAAMAFSFLSAFLTLARGPWSGPLLSPEVPAFSVYLDALSALLQMLVSFLAAVVVGFSRNYLAGDAHHGRFSRWLCLTCASVLLLVVSGDLILFTLAWSGSSLCLHRLLVFYPDRPGALLAARKKFIFSRLGDVCLLGVIALSFGCFHTWNFHELFAAADQLRATAGGLPGVAIPVICGLLVLCALLKSAQFPFHSWLPDTMETPTPVSALMHAGVINAGGFLIVRLSPLVTLSPAALAFLALIGGFTALFASLTMLTHASVKRALAFSTVAQMGFMMLECGLGAFSLAVLHLIAHSLYKAHSFLASGSIIALARARWVPSGRPATHPLILAATVLISGSLTLGAAALCGVSPVESPRTLVLVLILLLSLAYMLWNLLSSSLRGALVLWGVLIGAGLSVIYFVLHRAIAALLASSVREINYGWGEVNSVIGLIVLGIFLVVLVFQTDMPQRREHRLEQALYVHARNGFYFTTLANRLVSRIWPLA